MADSMAELPSKEPLGALDQAQHSRLLKMIGSGAQQPLGTCQLILHSLEMRTTALLLAMATRESLLTAKQGSVPAEDGPGKHGLLRVAASPIPAGEPPCSQSLWAPLGPLAAGEALRRAGVKNCGSSG